MPDAPQDRFELAYRTGTPPWDIGRPQSEIVRLAAEGDIVGDVLDAGCGTGENALHLASLGHVVTGVDASPAAIERARAKAAKRGLAATFLLADALHLERIGRRFETVLDCGLFHTFPPAERRAYARSLWEVLAPDGALQLMCFSDEEPPGPGPYRIAESDIREAFDSAFELIRIRPGRFESFAHEGGARAWVATLVRR
jgi:SAM-dependent methyltransferase